MTDNRPEGEKLPTLPGHAGYDPKSRLHQYTADQMRAYARAAIAAHEARKAQAEPVEWPWLQALGELVGAAKDRDASREQQEADINAAHAKLFDILRSTSPVPAPAAEDDKRDAERGRKARTMLSAEDIENASRAHWRHPSEGKSVKADAAIDAALQSTKEPSHE